jgi:SAM-dependent methyltransferase
MQPQNRRVTVREGYDLWANSYDRTLNPIVVMDARHSLRILEPTAGELILDAGCGTGRNLGTILAAGARAVGIDFSANMLAEARAHSGADLLAADLQRPLPFADACFDAVLCALVGEHLTQLEQCLIEFRRVLKPGGRLIFSVYHPGLAAAGIEANFERDGIEYRLGAQPYSVQDYLDATSGAGFEEIAFAEFRGDARLTDQVPSAARYEGSPLLLLIAAT